MRYGSIIVVVLTALLALSALVGCGSPGIDRVDVTWDTSPPPRWGLYPGYRQEIPCPKGAAYHINVYSKDKDFTGGTVADAGYGLVFRPTAGARDIGAEVQDRDHLTIYATLRDKNGEARRLLCLRVERKGDKIYFEFPK